MYPQSTDLQPLDALLYEKEGPHQISECKQPHKQGAVAESLQHLNMHRR